MFRKKMVMVTGILTAASILAGCGAAGSSTGESASSSGSAQSEAQSQSEADSGAQTEISGESESASFRAEEGKTSEGVMKKIDEAGEAGKIANMSAEEYAYSDAYMEFLSARSDAMAESGKYASIFQPFYEKSMREILKDDGKSNVVYSPANVYIELAMLAQCTGGDTQKQILDLLGVKDASSLPAAVNAMLQANTAENPVVTLSLANSLWMQDDITYNEETLGKLADGFHTYDYVGDLAGQKANDALHKWINDNTGNLLTEAADGLQMDDSTVMALVSTLYLKASWMEKFELENTKTETFHGAEDFDVQMMHQTLSSDIYQGDGFRAVGLGLTDCGTMWIFLPDEGTDAASLPGNKDVYRVLSGDSSIDSVYADVNLSLPKFDVSSDTDMIADLKAMGVTDVFADGADFSPLTTDTDCLVSQLEHAARVKTDEDGVEAAAFTAAIAEATALMDKTTVDFTVDHPFLFVVQGGDGTVLFTGIVNQPEEK